MFLFKICYIYIVKFDYKYIYMIKLKLLKMNIFCYNMKVKKLDEIIYKIIYKIFFLVKIYLVYDIYMICWGMLIFINEIIV